MTVDDWKGINNKIKYNYARDNFFSELKDIEVEKERLAVLQLIDPYVGRYFSQDFVKRNVLRQTEEEIEEMSQEMMEDGSAQQYEQKRQVDLGLESGQQQ